MVTAGSSSAPARFGGNGGPYAGWGQSSLDLAGGGNGGHVVSGAPVAPVAGTPNTGGGGGCAGRSTGFTGAAGGSGLVIVRYVCVSP